MRELLNIRLMSALLACAGATVVLTAAPASAAGSYSPYAESPAAALARYVRTLASDPKDFAALIGAGRSALEMGDTQAAAGFFARADEVNPRSPLPQAGMGAVSVASGEPSAALPYFARAKELGAPLSMIGCDRGLAYDLMGQQAQAQADYRAALNGADRDEARRRLALSLAISGDKAGALQALAPLSAKGDPAVNRTRAFVLALSGDSNGAMTAINAAMPGSWARVAPFLQRLPALQSGQKAAAVNLGIFPDAGETAYAYASPSVGSPTTMSTDRLAGLDALLGQPPAPAPAAAPAWHPAPKPTQVSYSTPAKRPATATVRPQKLWLQLASGDANAFADQFERLKSREPELFDGIEGYVAKSTDRSRLLIGPFRGPNDARIFAEDLQSAGIRAMSFTNSPTDVIVPVGTQ